MTDNSLIMIEDNNSMNDNSFTTEIQNSLKVINDKQRKLKATDKSSKRISFAGMDEVIESKKELDATANFEAEDKRKNPSLPPIIPQGKKILKNRKKESETVAVAVPSKETVELKEKRSKSSFRPKEYVEDSNMSKATSEVEKGKEKEDAKKSQRVSVSAGNNRNITMVPVPAEREKESSNLNTTMYRNKAFEQLEYKVDMEEVITKYEKIKKIHEPKIPSKNEKANFSSRFMDNIHLDLTHQKKNINKNKMGIVPKEKKQNNPPKRVESKQDKEISLIFRRATVKDKKISDIKVSRKDEGSAAENTDDQANALHEKPIQYEPSYCSYCIKISTNPLEMNCKHDVCLKCAKESHQINEFLLEEDLNYVKCPKCNVKTYFQQSIEDLKKIGWKPITIIDKKDTNLVIANSPCEICPMSKMVKEYAEYECLNCDTVICYECKLRHLSNPRHSDHKLIQITQQAQQRLELTMCEIHHEPLKIYCMTEQKACCLVCGSFEKLHEGHNLIAVRRVIENATNELASSLLDTEGKIANMEKNVNEMMLLKQKLEDEQTNYINILNNKVEEIVETIRKRQKQIETSIKEVFVSRLSSLEQKIEIINLIINRYNYYKNIHCDKDIDILERVNQLKNLNSKIYKIELNPEFKDEATNASEINSKSLKHSLFVEDPSSIITKVMNKFDFLPLTEKYMDTLKRMFKDSTTVTEDLITNNLLVVLPKINSGNLLYRTSRDSCSPERFHEFCDNRGATLTIVKTDTGHVFGGFNPHGWFPEFMYTKSNDAFLFSITDGAYRKPLRCELKKSMAAVAIKQNEYDKSPGFGELNNSDLFIAFKQLSNSYSVLGNVYKCPKGYSGEEFLAGRKNKWKILDVEVYSIEVINEAEYYKYIKTT